MKSIGMLRPNLPASLAFAVSALLLARFSHLFYHHFQGGCSGQSERATPVLHGSDYASTSDWEPQNASTAEFGSFTHVFRRGQHNSRPAVRLEIDPTFTYMTSVCRGQKLYQKMQDTYANPAGSQGREFGLKDLKNGWSGIEQPVPIAGAYSRGWSGAFKEITDTTQNPFSDLRKFELEQDVEFTTDSGVKVKEQATDAVYDCGYSVKASLIIADFTQSPSFKLKENQPSITKAEIGMRVPPLHRLSDTIWTQWRQLSGDNNLNAGKLRYIGRSGVANPDTKYIMRAIFVAAKNSKTVPWPELRYSMNQQQGQALLGTPNGLATAYLLIDHPAILGPRNPVVTIWTDGTFRENTDSDDEDDDPAMEEASVNYYMLWDMGDPNTIPDFSKSRKLS